MCKNKFEYGWSNGKLLMEQEPLIQSEEELLKEIKELAFREMGERTRAGSGDDQAYVNSMYDELKKDMNSNLLVSRIVFRLCKQAEQQK